MPARGGGIGGHQRAHSGATDTWLTPPSLLEALGRFDLDPCCPPAMPWKTATTMFCEGETDGLAAAWRGRVWLNPPYGPRTGLWLRKLADHGNGIALVFARTETEMFQEFCWKRASGMLFLWGRLYFHTADGKKAKSNAGGPSVLVAYGQENVTTLVQSQLPGALWRPDPLQP